MFRQLRRKNRGISDEAARQLLKAERRGVLAVNGDDGYPYAVPVNYLYCEDEGKIYFHGSAAGHKADSIRNNAKVCFTVYGNETIKEEAWAPFMQSVVVFGRCAIISDRERVTREVRRLAEKYYPDAQLIDEEIESSGRAVQMFEITIEHLTGKEIQEK